MQALFIAQADRAELVRLNRLIKAGFIHLKTQAAQALPICGQSSRAYFRTI
jgi:hypothetical protein